MFIVRVLQPVRPTRVFCVREAAHVSVGQATTLRGLQRIVARAVGLADAYTAEHGPHAAQRIEVHFERRAAELGRRELDEFAELLTWATLGDVRFYLHRPCISDKGLGV